MRLGRAIVIIVGAIAELERSLIVERVRAAIVRHRAHRQSLGQIAKTFSISRATVARILKEEQEAVSKGFVPALLQVHENRPPETAA